ncbi:hypothetical protein ONZ51_g8344 [Trametes cubensis]|uniref:DUF6533 domain-containing protein n=1 Tax=Trametes cubensis TaxID=1111947 RepID=A0AAD7XAX1_9APHY|nr:hypothetical protein ONZ51_g8344 [Trametes cubensis]
MTSQADSELIAEVQSLIVGDYCQVAATTMLAYYYVTTLHDEFKYWYKRKLTCATLLYMANRYLTLTYALYVLALTPSSDQKNCVVQQITAVVLANAQYFPWAAFSALRTYALQKNVVLAIAVFLFSLSPVFITLSATHWLSFSVDPTAGCVPSEPVPPNVQQWLPLVLADFTVIVVTWATQYRQHRMARSILHGSGLATVLLQNGTIYFIVMSILNILQMMFEVLRIFSRNPGEVISNLSIFTEPVTAILVSSFMNDLRKAADCNAHQESLSSMGTVEFRVIGSIGASLIPSEDVTLEGNDAEMGSLEADEKMVEAQPPSGRDEVPLAFAGTGTHTSSAHIRGSVSWKQASAFGPTAHATASREGDRPASTRMSSAERVDSVSSDAVYVAFLELPSNLNVLVSVTYIENGKMTDTAPRELDRLQKALRLDSNAHHRRSTPS